MYGKYSSCINCGNQQTGSTVYKCSACGAIFCEACEMIAKSLLNCGRKCPKCGIYYKSFSGSPKRQVAGKIS